jgi:ABC-type multidrug transport system ATPase subunit
VIRSLSRGSRTILCSIRAPFHRVVRYMDDILLLGSGHLIYSGPVNSMGTYFDNIGTACFDLQLLDSASL